jgi:LacI family transcriptional regulator
MNLDQVARLARVSTATVSRVLNNTGIVRPATRARVMKAVEELKYSPNLHARSLAGRQNRSIGLIVSNLENPFFLDVFQTVEAGARAAGFELILASTDYRPERLLASVRRMIGRRVAGLAAIVPEADWSLLGELQSSHTPVVFCGAGAPVRTAAGIRVNYRQGMGQLISYLYGLGHRRLGFVGRHTPAKRTDERLNALRQTADRWPDLHAVTAVGSDSLEGGRSATRMLLGSHQKLTAIVCANDVMAIGALRELHENGIRVPQEVSVAGFDNIEWAQFCYPALTTVHIPRGRIGQIVCDCLMKPEKSLLGSEIVIDSELVVRDSTGPAPASGLTTRSAVSPAR